MRNRYISLVALLLCSTVAAGPIPDGEYSCKFRPRDCTDGSAEIQIAGGKVQFLNIYQGNCRMRRIVDDGCQVTVGQASPHDANLIWKIQPEATTATDKLFFSTIKISGSNHGIVIGFERASSRLYCDAQSSLPKHVVIPFKSGRCRATYFSKWR